MAERRGRSPEAMARRRAQTAAWWAAHPGYGKAWREAHREQERERRRRWRAAHPELLRAQWARRRARQAPPEIPPSHTGHELFERAREALASIGLHRDHHLRAWHDPIWEDACSAAVVAILEGWDPVAAARQVRSAELGYRLTHLQLFAA